MRDLLLFSTTRRVIKAEDWCLKQGLPIQVVAVPKNISSECGMAIAVEAGQGEKILALLQSEGHTASLHMAVSPKPKFDLLSLVEQGGCSAKLPADLLVKAIQGLKNTDDPRLLVGLDTCDDAGVVRLTDEIALIETTDFFPPICSDPFEFGQIAAANALSDVFAMGGQVLSCLNLVMFPVTGIPFEVLGEILQGGQEKVIEGGGIIVGGHTIADFPPKYGLAVTGIVHPSRIISNTQASPGELLILTKPLGTGILVAGHRLGEAHLEDYRRAIETMKLLNRSGAEIMQKYEVRAATDITGFGLLGHARHIANGSQVTLNIDSNQVPIFPGAAQLADLGCIPGGSFKNQGYVEEDTHFSSELSYEKKMLLLDPQTSGGLLMCIASENAQAAIDDLWAAGYKRSSIIGRVTKRDSFALLVT